MTENERQDLLLALQAQAKKLEKAIEFVSEADLDILSMIRVSPNGQVTHEPSPAQSQRNGSKRGRMTGSDTAAVRAAVVQLPSTVATFNLGDIENKLASHKFRSKRNRRRLISDALRAMRRTGELDRVEGPRGFGEPIVYRRNS